MVLEAAKEWGCAPWVIEAEASAVWWQRWMCWREELAALAKRGEQRHKQAGMVEVGDDG